MSGTTLLRRHPLPHLPWRIVAHVLAVTALELRHPVVLGILMEAGDGAVDARHASSGGALSRLI